MNNNLFAKVLPHLVALAVFVAISVFYFHPQLEGKVIPQGDMINFYGMSQEIKEHKEKTGEAALWTNAMFGGMPTYQIHTPTKNSVFKTCENILCLGFDRPIGYFIYGLLAFYIMLLLLGVNPWLSIIGAIAFSFTTNNIVLFEAGHTTKVRAIMASPLIIGGMIAVFRKKYILGGLVFTLGMGLNLMANHYQMTYYLGLCLLILVIIELIKAIKQKDFTHIIRGGVVLLIGLIIGIGGSASKFLTTYEYAKDTMRGVPILENTGEVSSSSETDGLEYGYAMTWSNGVLDLFSSFIPGVVGGSSSETVSSSSTFAKEIRKLGGGKVDKAPLYWGALPFTSGPIYFGAVIFFLFIFSLFILKGSVRWWILSATLLTLFLSLGKNGGVLNEIIYNYVPLYNKFRTPNSILSITAIFIPMFALMGFSNVIKSQSKEDFVKPLYFSVGAFSVLCLFFAFIGPSFFDFTAAGDARIIQSVGKDILSEDRVSLMRGDALRSLGLTLLFAAGLWAFLKGKLKAMLLIALFGVLTLFDVIGVGKRYVNTNDFVAERNIASTFALRNVDKQIKTDSDLSYRVLDQTVDPFNSSKLSYHHKSIGGYHAAKLQRYQDLIDRHISKGNQRVINMLNTKYIIIPQENGEAIAQLNPAAAGNAWFVNNIKVVDSADEEIDALSTFDPLGEAIVHKEFEEYIQGLSTSKNGTITLTEYSPDKLLYSSTTQGDQFAVFSEIWYGPDKGWYAYIDDKPVEFIRTNYALRGLKVPSGNHTIRFEFDPPLYNLGTLLNLIFSIIFMGFALIGGFMLWKNRENTTSVKQSAGPDNTNQEPLKDVKKQVRKKKKK